MRKLIVTLFIFLSVVSLYAQRRGGPPSGMLETMMAREKQALYDKAEDLSKDQKMLLDGIYDEFTVTLKETFEENRSNREAMRTKLMALRKEKDELIADVLNEEQYQVYENITAKRREERKSRMQQAPSE